MKLLKRILLGLLVLFIVMQFFQPKKNHSTEMLPTDLTKTINVPENVQSLLKRACYDCHSNNTDYPWYSVIQPFGWFLANHIMKGKAELNFSDFGSYSLRRQISKMNGIAVSMKDSSMPLSSYAVIHRNARLSKDEKALLIEWSTRMKESLRMNN